MGNKMVDVPSEAIAPHLPEQQRNGHLASNGHILGQEESQPLQQNGTLNKKTQVATARKRRRMRLCLVISAVIVVIFIGIGIGAACVFRNPRILRYPLHASCNITWTLGTSCNNAKQALIDQIDTWKGNDTCAFGQKCLYKLEANENNLLKATHTTPVRKYIDDLTFTFYPFKRSGRSGCNILGYSTSRIWFAVLDYGTNYCNLHNLIDGAGLMKDKIYSELTRDEICTQYSSANCDKY